MKRVHRPTQKRPEKESKSMKYKVITETGTILREFDTYEAADRYYNLWNGIWTDLLGNKHHLQIRKVETQHNYKIEWHDSKTNEMKTVKLIAENAQQAQGAWWRMIIDEYKTNMKDIDMMMIREID